MEKQRQDFHREYQALYASVRSVRFRWQILMRIPDRAQTHFGMFFHTMFDKSMFKKDCYSLLLTECVSVYTIYSFFK